MNWYLNRNKACNHKLRPKHSIYTSWWGTSTTFTAFQCAKCGFVRIVYEIPEDIGG